MKRLSYVFVALAFALTVQQALAQPPRGGGMGMRRFRGEKMFLLSQQSVRDELKLSDEQDKQIKEFGEKHRESFRGFRELNQEERQKRMDENRKTVNYTLAGILKPEQSERLEQISLQQRGIGDPEVIEKLDLTAEQKDRIKAIAEDTLKQMRELPRDGDRDAARQKREELRTATEEKLTAVLTSDQQAKWKSMTGEPFKGEIRPPQFPGRRGGGDGQRSGDSAAATRGTIRLVAADTASKAASAASEEPKSPADDSARTADRAWAQVARALRTRGPADDSSLAGHRRRAVRRFYRGRWYGPGPRWAGPGGYGPYFAQRAFGRHHVGWGPHHRGTAPWQRAPWQFAGWRGHRGHGPHFAAHRHGGPWQWHAFAAHARRWGGPRDVFYSRHRHPFDGPWGPYADFAWHHPRHGHHRHHGGPEFAHFRHGHHHKHHHADGPAFARGRGGHEDRAQDERSSRAPVHMVSARKIKDLENQIDELKRQLEALRKESRD